MLYSYNYLLPITVVSALVVFALPTTIQAQTSQQRKLEDIARELTVRIEPPTDEEDGGSGVIVARQGNLYTVLTAWHVVNKGLDSTSSFIIRTRKEQFSIPIKQIQKLPNLELAILQFTSNQEYEVARLVAPEDSLSRQKEGTGVYAAGWTTPTVNVQGRLYIFSKGSMYGRIPFSEGYESLVYRLDDAQKGMSGGPVLTEDGALIAITNFARPDPITGQYNLISGIPVDQFSGVLFALGLITTPSTETATSITPEKVSALRVNELIKLAGEERYRNRKVALSYLEQALLLEPKEYRIYFARSSMLQGSEAISDLTEAIRLASSEADNRRILYRLYFNRADQYEVSGNQQAAIEDYESAVLVNPNGAEALNNLGLVYCSLKNYSKAIDYFSRTTQVYRDSYDSYLPYFNLANTYLLMKDIQRAIDTYTNMIELDLNGREPTPRLLFDRGVLYARIGNFQKAITDLQLAMKIYSESTIVIQEGTYPAGSYSYTIKGMRGSYIKKAPEQIAQLIQALYVASKEQRPPKLLDKAIIQGFKRFSSVSPFSDYGFSRTGETPNLFRESNRTYVDGLSPR